MRILAAVMPLVALGLAASASASDLGPAHTPESGMAPSTLPVSLSTTNATATGTHTTHAAHDKAILFLTVVLMIGAALKFAVNRYRIPLPYTVLLLVVGIVMGAVNVRDDDALDIFGDAMDVFAEMDPHLLLVIFLPPLIFESSFATNFHIVWREIGQALLLAGPGVAISAVLTALVAKYIFPYDWSWSITLMFGAMMSATDPVAVVALLREVGASKRLATLIEAESLLNDGTAFVMFLVFRDFAIGMDRTGGEIITYMLRLSVGGVLLGLVMGMITCFCISHVFNDAQVETIATLSVAYLTFYLAESKSTGLEVSGVLAVVALGLYMSKNKAAVSPRIESNVHHVWDMLAYIANTLIFVISGVIVANNLFHETSGQTVAVGWGEVGYMLVLYLFLMAIRSITVFALSPALSRVGYGLTFADACVLVYGGLRGAIGLALGLLVQLEEDLSRRDRDLIMFFMSSIVVMTLVINGSTTKNVLVWTGLAKVKRASNRVYTKALRHLEKETDILISSLKHHKHYSGANWGEIRKMLPQYGDRVRDAETADKQAALLAKRAAAVVAKAKGHHAADAKAIADPDKEDEDEGKLEDTVRVMIDNIDIDEIEMELKLEVSHRFLSAMKACYWHQYEEGMTTRRAVSVLVEAAETALDIDTLQDLYLQWEDIQHHFVIPTWMSRLQNCFPTLGNRMLYSRLAFSVELATGFLMASESIDEIEKHFPEFGEFDVVNMLKEECLQYRKEALDVWLQIQNSFPEVYRSIQTKHAAQFILTKEKHTIQELYELGILDERESVAMNELVDKSMYHLERARPLTHALGDRNTILQELDFFAQLPTELQERMRSCVVQVFNPETELFTVGDRLSCVYIIVRGIVNIYAVDEKTVEEVESGSSSHVDDSSVQAMGVGNVLGMYEALSQHVAFETAKSKTYVEAVILPASVLAEFSEIDHLQQYLWKIAAIAVIKSHFMSDFGFSAVSVGRICQRAVFVRAQAGDYITVSTPILLLTGTAIDSVLQAERHGPTFFPVTNRELSFTSDANLLVFRARRKTPRPPGADPDGGVAVVPSRRGSSLARPLSDRHASDSEDDGETRKRALSRAADRVGMMRINTFTNVHSAGDYVGSVRHDVSLPGTGQVSPKSVRLDRAAGDATAAAAAVGSATPSSHNKQFRVRRMSRHLKGHVRAHGRKRGTTSRRGARGGGGGLKRGMSTSDLLQVGHNREGRLAKVASATDLRVPPARTMSRQSSAPEPEGLTAADVLLASIPKPASNGVGPSLVASPLSNVSTVNEGGDEEAAAQEQERIEAEAKAQRARQEAARVAAAQAKKDANEVEAEADAKQEEEKEEEAAVVHVPPVAEGKEPAVNGHDVPHADDLEFV